MNKNVLEVLQREGYFFKESAISEIECLRIKDYLENKESPAKIPFSKVAWGYGNLIEDENLKSVYENPYIVDICRRALGDDFEFNHLMINNKAPWIGPSVEWHQETFNVDTYAPGAIVNDESWKNFLQCYIALDEHTIENGCLKIIPSTHKEELPHEDMVNENFGHKRRVPCDVMTEIYNKYGLKNITMNPGDALIFNHRIVHGSSSNTSPKERKGIVLQARTPFVRNEEVFANETSHRTNFVIEAMEQKVKGLKQKNKYTNFAEKC